MTDTLYNLETLLEILRRREATIRFRKVNGDLRVMRCTLKTSLLPQTVIEALERSESKPHHNDEVVTVYDLDTPGWRSFRLDSIIEVL